MIREPYGLSPNNITIDTTLAGDYNFIFSGDELESFQVEIAENNTSASPKYTSDIIDCPGTYNNSEINTAILPSYVYHGTDGSIIRSYEVLFNAETAPAGITTIRLGGYDFTPVNAEDEFFTFTQVAGLNGVWSFNIEGSALLTIDNVVSYATVQFFNTWNQLVTTIENAEINKESSVFEFPDVYQVVFTQYDPNNSDWRIQIGGNSYSVQACEYDNDRKVSQITLDTSTLGQDAYIDNTGDIIFTLFDQSAENSEGYSVADYFNTCGLDLIWRITQWENNTIFTEDPAAFAQDATDPYHLFLTGDHIDFLDTYDVTLPYIANLIVGEEIRRIVEVDATTGCVTVSRPFGEMSLLAAGTPYVLSTNFTPNEINFANNLVKNGLLSEAATQTNIVESGVLMPLQEVGTSSEVVVESVIKGDNLRIKDSATGLVWIPLDDTLVSQLVGKTIDIDNIPYTIASAETAETVGYVACTLNENLSQMTNNTICYYVIYDISDDSMSSVTKTTYTWNDKYHFVLDLGGHGRFSIEEYEVWEYSDGDLRAFATLDERADLTIPQRNYPFKLYSNFYRSNWYFFQSRLTPKVKITNPPKEDYDSRIYTFKGSYFQQNLIPIKSHRWIVEDLNSLSNPVLMDTGEIFTSRLEFTYDLFEEQGLYKITLSVTNQENVTTDAFIIMNTLFNTINVNAQGTVTVNEKQHAADITWLNSITSAPIGGDKATYDYKLSLDKTAAYLNAPIEFNKVSGANLNLTNYFVVKAGFTIDDLAEYYTSNIIQLNTSYRSAPMILKKRDTSLFMLINNEEYHFETALGKRLNLLEGVEGQQRTQLTDGDKTKYDYLWLENDESEEELGWKETYYWTETSTNMDSYYYEVILTAEQAIIYQYAYARGENAQILEENKVRIPYNIILPSTNLEITLDSGTKTTYKILDCTEVTDNDEKYLELTLDTESISVATDVPYLIYTTAPEQYTTDIFHPSVVNFNSVVFANRLNLFYATIYQANQLTYQNLLDPLGMDQKPEWDLDAGMQINLNHNSSLISQFLDSGENAVTGYKIYRNKYGTDSVTLISSEFIGQFQLSDLQDSTSDTISYTDWTVPSKGYYDYTIIPLTNSEKSRHTISTNRVLIDLYGWSFTQIGQIAEDQYMPLEQWVFDLNLTTNGYTHNINKTFHQGLSKYPKVAIGVTDYITTNLSCLIGDLESRASQNTFNMWEYKNDTIEKIERWKDFARTNNPIIVKDARGNVFIGSITNNTFAFQEVGGDILTTLSFDITQIDDIDKYKVFTHGQSKSLTTYSD